MDNIYVAGNFNLWSTSDKNFVFSKSNNRMDSLTISLPRGNYEYKFTRGNWKKVETDSLGNRIQNWILKLNLGFRI